MSKKTIHQLKHAATPPPAVNSSELAELARMAKIGGELEAAEKFSKLHPNMTVIVPNIRPDVTGQKWIFTNGKLEDLVDKNGHSVTTSPRQSVKLDRFQP
jgi:hypothetical protein